MNNLQITPQDEALDEFRQAFKMPLLGAQVSDDGTEMRVRVNIDRVAARYLLQANALITANGFPLTASIREWKSGTVLFARWLVISFDHSKSLLPCY